MSKNQYLNIFLDPEKLSKVRGGVQGSIRSRETLPRGKAAGACCLPLTSKDCRGYEDMELYPPFPCNLQA
jgi:hypothetical protein